MPAPQEIYIMLDSYLIIFQQTVIQLVPLIIPVFGIYMVIKLISGLLFER